MNQLTNALIAATIAAGPISLSAQTTEQIGVNSGKASQILILNKQDEAKILKYLKSEYLLSLTSGKEKAPLFDYFHKNWHTFSVDFQTKFGLLLIESLIKRGLLDASFLKEKITHTGAMFNMTSRSFYIELGKKGENGEPIKFNIVYDYNGDVYMDKDILKAIESVGFSFSKDENAIEFRKTVMTIQYLGDGSLPPDFGKSYSSRSPLKSIDLKGVKTFEIIHNQENGDVIITLSFENSKKGTQIYGHIEKSGTGV